jgi:Na+-transporting NADH:ubiquinone oxidoreductase subunit A
MAHHRTSKGLSIPLAGEPDTSQIEDRRTVDAVALLASDYHGLKPSMMVQVGDVVHRGQPLFEDKQLPGVRHTAPYGGEVIAIHRGERRAFHSLVLRLSDEERADSAGSALKPFSAYSAVSGRDPLGYQRDEVRALLLESGLWTAIRRRPFGSVADPTTEPAALFITAMDSEPHAPPAEKILIGDALTSFRTGVAALATLTSGTTFVCSAAELTLPLNGLARVQHETFSGPHPAGTVGFHIHTLRPVSQKVVAWYIHYSDVLAIGELFATGKLASDRVISLAGPGIQRPRLVRTRLGAALDQLVAGELAGGEMRVISGSALAGRAATGEIFGYLGRYDHQVTALREGRQREFLGWLAPGFNKFSALPAFISALLPGRRFALDTSTNGSHRAIVPIGLYERVMPFDILPTFLLRSLAVTDVERAEQLGALELEEPDLALCTFVCPGKNDYGTLLRRTLDIIEKEG